MAFAPDRCEVLVVASPALKTQRSKEWEKRNGRQVPYPVGTPGKAEELVKKSSNENVTMYAQGGRHDGKNHH